MSDYRVTYVTPEINVVDGRLTGHSPEQLQRIVNYKALAFQRDRNLSALSYEIKRTRAVFDPGLGPSGGFRCPVGTRYGGQITDRFGRGCGWGVARRLLNTVVDAGERLEEVGDRRRGRRVERRNRRVGRQIGKPVAGRRAPAITGGRVDRAAEGADRLAGRARRFAQRMDGNAGRPRSQRRGRNITGGRVDRAAEGADRFADRARRFARRMDGNSGRANRRQPAITGGRVDRAAEGADRFAGRARRFAERIAGPGAGGRPRSDRNEADAPAVRPVGRRRRTTAINDAVSSRPRPARPRTEPAAIVRRPNARQQGARIDVDNLTPERRERLDVLVGRERDRVNDFWDRRIEGDVTAEKIQQFVDERAERSNMRWRNTVAARKREWEILNSDNASERVNELGPTARKRIADGLDDPNTPRPAKKAAKKRPAKKAAQKRPAKKAPAKKASAKKAAAKRTSTRPPVSEAPANPEVPEAENPEVPEGENPAPRGRAARLLDAYRGLPVRRRNKRRGAIATKDGRSRNIVNRNIRTEAQAVEFVRNGGSLDKVPNEFWRAALTQNSSPDAVDRTTRFRMIDQNGGNVGTTSIFVVRDDNGKSLDQGWVIKGAALKETAAEVGSQYFALRAGLPVEGAGWDGVGGQVRWGRAGDENRFAVLPHVLNGVGGGNVRMPQGEANFDLTLVQDLPDKAHPQRFANLLHNWMLGVGDRHSGNGIIVRRGNKAYVFPIDQGWAGREVRTTPRAFPFFMDNGFWRETRDHLDSQRLSLEERREQARALVKTYDDMLERAEETLREGRQAYIEATIGGVPAADRRVASQTLGDLFDLYQDQTARMRQKRSDVLQDLLPVSLQDLI